MKIDRKDLKPIRRPLAALVVAAIFSTLLIGYAEDKFSDVAGRVHMARISANEAKRRYQDSDLEIVHVQWLSCLTEPQLPPREPEIQVDGSPDSTPDSHVRDSNWHRAIGKSLQDNYLPGTGKHYGDSFPRLLINSGKETQDT